MKLSRLAGAGLFCAAIAPYFVGAQNTEQKGIDPEFKCRVIYVPTEESVVDKMLDMAKVKKADIVYDLGCGDGRIVCMAAKKYGAQIGRAHV